jgi:adenosylmethionine-8-amino-7-oxononanoate aminotransferase
MACLELVSDRGKKTPVDKGVVSAIFECVYRAGVMLRISGNILIISPPLVISAEDVRTILAAIDQGLSAS